MFLLGNLQQITYLDLESNKIQYISSLYYIDMNDIKSNSIKVLLLIIIVVYHIQRSQNRLVLFPCLLSLMQNIITLQTNNLELNCIFTPKLKYLTYLNLSANPVRDTNMLKWQDQLDTLGLCSTSITCIDFIKPLVKLTKLSISLNQIVDVSPITFLLNLNFLNVNECKICNVAPLSKLIELQHVYLRSNRILDVTPINSLENLRYLDIAENCIQNIKDLIIRKQVRYVTSNQSHAKKHVLMHFKRTCTIRTCTQMVAKFTSKKYQFIERINLGKRQVFEQQYRAVSIKQKQILALQLLNSMIQSSIYESQ
ncbi:DUF2252_family protein [Hexamita inflata]|uniref:DUF2252 family protein n=1 Tax=Hexamita inflata TaxID=28002 RepID=A0AA86P6A2_9EUKA|nr:DUF2252 family protein [Hexamita inflata]